MDFHWILEVRTPRHFKPPSWEFIIRDIAEVYDFWMIFNHYKKSIFAMLFLLELLSRKIQKLHFYDAKLA
jgi:hypothetical protein